mmetsp:Transcript_22956/g.53046  ORF Transcript_22956/g.53046 Transcript_22956/m.53046 type:complete len:324 (+) Transcript_22956:431-1402(+)
MPDQRAHTAVPTEKPSPRASGGRLRTFLGSASAGIASSRDTDAAKASAGAAEGAARGAPAAGNVLALVARLERPELACVVPAAWSSLSLAAAASTLSSERQARRAMRGAAAVALRGNCSLCSASPVGSSGAEARAPCLDGERSFSGMSPCKSHLRKCTTPPDGSCSLTQPLPTCSTRASSPTCGPAAMVTLSDSLEPGLGAIKLLPAVSVLPTVPSAIASRCSGGGRALGGRRMPPVVGCDGGSGSSAQPTPRNRTRTHACAAEAAAAAAVEVERPCTGLATFFSTFTSDARSTSSCWCGNGAWSCGGSHDHSSSSVTHSLRT